MGSFAAGAGTKALAYSGNVVPFNFGPLTLTGGTVTTSTPVIDATQTWNAAGVTFTGIKFNATDTASAAGSLLMDLQVGGVSRFFVGKDSNFSYRAANNQEVAWDGRYLRLARNTSVTPSFTFDAGFGYTINLASPISINWTASNSDAAPDLSILRDAADTLAQRRGTNAQTFRIYNTFTDASNYERGFLRWSSNILQIGAEAAGTGTSRDIQFWGYGRRIMTLTDSATLAAHIVGQSIASPPTPLGTLSVATLTNGVNRTGLDLAWSDGAGNRQGGFRFSDTQVPGDWVACQMEMVQSTGDSNEILSRLTDQNSAWAGMRFVSQTFAGAALTTSPTFQWRNFTTVQMTIDSNNNIVLNNAAIATNATNGFIYVAGCAGTPTGVPTSYAGRVPIVVDTTNNKLYFYSGGVWRDAGP